jgi:hypothetical protein
MFTLNEIAPQRDISVKSLTLRQKKAASLTNLHNVVVERNGVVVSNGYSVNGKDLTIMLNDLINKDTTSAQYTIKSIITNVETSGDEYQFELRNTSDFNAIEKDTAFRTSLTGTAYTFGTYTIAGGELTFARDTNLALSKDYSA